MCILLWHVEKRVQWESRGFRTNKNKTNKHWGLFLKQCKRIFSSLWMYSSIFATGDSEPRGRGGADEFKSDACKRKTTILVKMNHWKFLQPFTFPPGSCLAALWAAAKRLHAVLPAFRIYRGPEKHSHRYSLKHTFKSPLLFSVVFALESQNCMNVTHLQQFMSSIFQLLWCYTEICKQPWYEFQHKWLTFLCMCT